MIGYYVHHQGSGHLHRAGAVARALGELGESVIGLSSLPRPDGWHGDWVRLAADDRGATPTRVTAGGRLHWAPLGDGGLRSRMAAVSSWLDRARPDLLVVDVSVEVALLARLHGVPVVSLVMPGVRDDPAHQLGYAVSEALVAVWPESARGMVTGLSDTDRQRLHCVGGLSRFPVRVPGPRRPGPRRAVVLLGDGGGAGGGVDTARLEDARRLTPGWEWTVLGRATGTWTADPFAVMGDADVVVTHAGQNAVAEVAAARRPALIVPGSRPHEEQTTTALALAAGPWPVRVRPHLPATGWAELLDEVAALDGDDWSSWTDDRAATRFADALRVHLVTPSLEESA